jgi:hypothetical protein
MTWRTAVIRVIGIVGGFVGGYISVELAWRDGFPPASRWIEPVLLVVGTLLGYWFSIYLAVWLGVRAGLLTEEQASDVIKRAPR